MRIVANSLYYIIIPDFCVHCITMVTLTLILYSVICNSHEKVVCIVLNGDNIIQYKFWFVETPRIFIIAK